MAKKAQADSTKAATTKSSGSAADIEETIEIANIKPVVIPIEDAKGLIGKLAPKQVIEELVNRSAHLSIIDEKDKEGYDLVHKEWQRARDIRLNIEKTRKIYTNPVVVYQKEVNAYAKELTAMVEPTEKILGSKLEFIDNIIEERKLEKQRLIEEAFNKRVATAYQSGLTFDGQVYRFEDIVITPVDLREWSDGELQNFFNTVAERKALRIQEQEEAAEVARVEKQRNDDLAKKNLELQDRLDKAAKQLEDSRIRQLIGLGMEHRVDGFYVPGAIKGEANYTSVLKSSLSMDDNEWTTMFDTVKSDMERYTIAEKEQAIVKEQQATADKKKHEEADENRKQERTDKLLEDIKQMNDLYSELGIAVPTGSNDVTQMIFREVKIYIDNARSKLSVAIDESKYVKAF